jgi:hypothetical protein
MNCTRIAKSAVVAALVTLSLSQLAFADVILAESDNILGTAQGSKRYDFTVLTPGQYLATLTDLGTPNGWPAPFTDLGMVISEKGGGNPHSLILAAGNSSGSLSFAAIAKTYTLQVIGQPDPNVEHLPGGAFSVQVASVAPASVDTPSPSAVPEPTSWLMLIAGMSLLGAVSLRNRRD